MKDKSIRARRSWICRVMIASAAAVFAMSLDAQVQRSPMALSEVNHLLRNYVGPRQVGEIAIRYRISFQVTTEVAEQLTKVGADKELITTLRSVEPSANPVPAPMPETVSAGSVNFTPSTGTSLVVNSPVGGVEIYLDDVRQGKASLDGKLKIPDLTPGQRKLRISLEGYKDLEEVVELKPGQTTNQLVPPLRSEQTQPSPQTLVASAVVPSSPPTVRAAIKPLAGEPVFVKDAFHIVGIPAIRRNKKIDLSITTKDMEFLEGGRRVYQIPFERIERVQMNLEKRDYAKTTYAAVVALGAPGAVVLAYKRSVDALVINYRNERNGTMEMVIQVSKGMGTPCLERLAAGGVPVGPPSELD
jgi:hypothetical protein